MIRFLRVLYWQLFGESWWTHPDVREIRNGLDLSTNRPIVGYEREAYDRERRRSRKERLKNNPDYRQKGLSVWPLRSCLTRFRDGSTEKVLLLSMSKMLKVRPSGVGCI